MDNINIKQILRRNYGNIAHMTGSRMISDQDKLICKDLEACAVTCLQDRHDVVIITEKLDGCNVGVLKHEGKLYAVMRRGYSVWSSEYRFIRVFGEYVYFFKNRFHKLLGEGERVVGEWMFKKHTLGYHMKCSPFVAYDLFTDDNRPMKFWEARERCLDSNIEFIAPVHIGKPMPVQDALNLLGYGNYGAIEGIEGVVYRYENLERLLFRCKYVSNPLMGDEKYFELNIDDDMALNRFNGKWSYSHERFSKMDADILINGVQIGIE